MCGIVATSGAVTACPSCWRGWTGWSTAATTRPASPCSSRRRAAACTRPRAGCADLAAGLPARFKGSPGIGHTRWATHGEPSDVNAHPHVDAAGRIAIVHNGIIENADELRAKLAADGVVFASETDTEVLAHLIAASTGRTSLEDAVREALTPVEGTYGIVVLDARQPGPASSSPATAARCVLGIGEQGDVRRLRRRRARALHPPGRAPGRRRAGGGHAPTATGPPPSTPAPPPSEPVHRRPDAGAYDTERLRALHAQGDPRAARARSSARCAAGSTSRFATAHLGGLQPRRARTAGRSAGS